MFLNVRRLAVNTSRLRLRQAKRLQHNGGHKEYFQDPNSLPTRQSLHSDSTPQPSYGSLPRFNSPKRQSSNVIQALRSLTLIATFTAAGIFSAGALLSWAYVNEPFPPGSDADTAMLDEIEELFESHYELQNLRADPDWVELVAMPSMDKNLKKSMMSSSLNGSRGIQTRVFFNSKRKLVNMFVCFGGGVEGWPDIVHGGAFFIVMQEAMHYLMSSLYPRRRAVVCQMGADFRVKMRPQVIYRLIAAPKNILIDTTNGVSLLKDNPEQEEAMKVSCTLVDDDTLYSSPPRAQLASVHVDGWGIMSLPDTPVTADASLAS